MTERLSDRVQNIITHNEPWVTAAAGYFSGEHAPGIKDPAATIKAIHHLLLSHGLAAEAIRASAAFLTSAAHSAEDCREIIERYSSLAAIRAALEQARILLEEEMNELEVSSAGLKDFQTLLSLLISASFAMRANPERLAANQKGQASLWPYAISGDYPILMVELGAELELNLARELLQAHAYWRKRRLMIDLVFLDKQGTSYNQELSTQFNRLVASLGSDGWLNRRGGTSCSMPTRWVLHRRDRWC